MKILALVLVAILLEQTHLTHADLHVNNDKLFTGDAAYKSFRKTAHSFDPFPHPPFPQIDCDRFQEIMDSLPEGERTCPEPADKYDVTGYAHPEGAPPQNAEDRDDRYSSLKDYRVCAEYRRWFPSHCIMRHERCSLLAAHFNLIGMCHKPRGKSHHFDRKTPYEVNECDPDYFMQDQYAYCPKMEEYICGTYMKTYKSLCHLEQDWCENRRPHGGWELAKILSPKGSTQHGNEYMMAHNKYSQCGMYNPLAHQHQFKSLNNFTSRVEHDIFKYDHVCENLGQHEFDLTKGGSVKANAYSYRSDYADKKAKYCPPAPHSETENVH